MFRSPLPGLSRLSTLAGFVRPAFATLALLAASASHADYFWIDRDAGLTRIQAGELGKPQATLPAVQGARAFQAGNKPVTLDATAAQYTAQPAEGDLRFTASRAEERVLTVFHARFGRQETTAASELELVPTRPGGNTFRLYWKGSAVNASQVNVQTSEGWSRVLRPGADGTVSFDPVFPALYVLEVSARVNGAAVVDGKKYEEVRHVATLAFRVEGR